MDNLDKLKREIASMSKKVRAELAKALESKLSDKQQNALKELLSSKSGKAELEKALEGSNFSAAGSKDELLKMMNSAQMKKKIQDILG